MRDYNLYLLASYTARPKDPSKTKIKGYMKDPANIVYDEVVAFAVGLKSRDLNESGVVLNLTGRTVVKNRFNSAATFDDVVKYFCEAYPEYMDKVGFTLEETKDEPTDVQEKESRSVPAEAQEAS